MLTLIRCPFHLRVTAETRKRPRSFRQQCRWPVTPKHAYTLHPTKSERVDYAAVQAECGNQSGNELIFNSSGNARPQSSQLAEPLWADPDPKSEISVREQGMNDPTFFQNPRKRGKKKKKKNTTATRR